MPLDRAAGVRQAGRMACCLVNSIAQATAEGWVEHPASMQETFDGLLALGAKPLEARRSSGYIMALRPVDRSEAHSQSLSARFGKGPLPLHTDGAHFSEPPDVVLIQRSSPSCGADTLLFTLDPALELDLSSALDLGMFLVGRGRHAFLAPARAPGGCLRFDPGCMKPLDRRARAVARYFEAAASRATPYCWTSSSTLIIDNRRVLHGRTDALQAADRVLKRAMLTWRPN